MWFITNSVLWDFPQSASSLSGCLLCACVILPSMYLPVTQSLTWILYHNQGTRLGCLPPLLKIGCLVSSFRVSCIILGEKKQNINKILRNILNKCETDSLPRDCGRVVKDVHRVAGCLLPFDPSRLFSLKPV